MNLRTIYISAYLITILLVSACSGIEVEKQIPLPSDVEIIPQASLSTTRSHLSGVVDGSSFPKSTDSIFAVTAFLDIDGKERYFSNQPVHSDSNGKCHFETYNGQRYYPEDGSPLYFHAVSPVPDAAIQTDPTKIIWNLTGQEDIMYANDLTGIKKTHGSELDSIHQPQPEFKFNHLLTRFNIRERWGNGFPDKMTISEVKILNCIGKATVDLINEKIINDAKDETTDFIYTVAHEINALVHFADVCSIMCFPYDNMESIELEILVSDIKYGPVKIFAPKGGTFEAGVSYNIDLEFESNRILVYTAVADWEDGGSSTEGHRIL